MSRTQLGVLSTIALLCIAGVVALVHQSNVALRAENQILEHQLTVAQLTTENQRLSNLVAQTKLVQASTRAELEDLTKLRAEMSLLQREREASNQLFQAQLTEHATNQLRELTALRSEIYGLGEEIGYLREGLQEVYTGTATPSTAERANQTTPGTEDRALVIRMIETHGDGFAERLKSAAGATEGESFQEVFGRYLRSNGIDLSSVGALLFDERTGRVIVRAPRTMLDSIERLTVALDRGQ